MFRESPIHGVSSSKSNVFVSKRHAFAFVAHSTAVSMAQRVRNVNSFFTALGLVCTLQHKMVQHTRFYLQHLLRLSSIAFVFCGSLGCGLEPTDAARSCVRNGGRVVRGRRPWTLAVCSENARVRGYGHSRDQHGCVIETPPPFQMHRYHSVGRIRASPISSTW